MLADAPRKMRIDGQIVQAWRSTVAIKDPVLQVAPGDWVIQYPDGSAKSFGHEQFCRQFGSFAREAGFPEDQVRGLGFGTPDDPRNY